MNIATLVTGPWQANGVCRVAESWTRILTRAGHRVTIFCQDGGSAPEIEGCTVHEHASPTEPSRILRWRERGGQLVRTLTRTHAETPFDAVISHDFLPAIGVRKALPGIPLAQTIHSPIVDENRLNNWVYTDDPWRRASYPATWMMAKRLEAQALRAVDQVHTLSRFTWQRLNARHHRLCESVDWTRIPGTFDDRRFVLPEDRDAVRRRLGLPERAVVILTVRRLVPRNGVDRIPECARRLRDANAPVLFLIGGTGPERPRIEAQIARLQVGDDVRLLGFIEEDALPSWYQAADYFLLPTRALECFGLPVIEASACGAVPLIVPDGGPQELVTDKACVASANTDAAYAELVARHAATGGARDQRARSEATHRQYAETTVAPAVLDFVDRLARRRA